MKTQEFFNKQGGKAVIFSRFLPIFRTVAPFVAGVGKMNFGKFTYFNIVGGLAWIISFLGLGFVFGNIPVIKDNFTYVMLVIIVLTILPAIFAGIKTKRDMKKSAGLIFFTAYYFPLFKKFFFFFSLPAFCHC